MSLLMHTIKLRLLINQLTNTEFNKFTSRLVKQYGREIICTSLFQHKSQQIEDILDIAVNIINKRRKNRIKNNHIKPKVIDEIPSELLSEISSFLEQKDYASFSRANRSIYIACNDPNTLQILDLLDIGDYSTIKLENYTSITELRLNLAQFSQFDAFKMIKISDQQSIANKLQHLVLDGDDMEDIHIETFINQNPINFTELKVLSCRWFNNKHKIYELLSKFSMIKHLVCHMMNIGDDVTGEQIKELFPNLNLLNMTLDGVFSLQLLGAFSTQLETLNVHQNYGGEFDYDVSNIEFNKLENLMLICPTSFVLNEFVNAATPNIKNILIGVRAEDEINGLKQAVHDLIVKKASLEYIEFEIGEHLPSIINNLECALYKTRGIEREEFTIYLDIDFEEYVHDIDNVMIYLCRITNVLKDSKIEDFMLTFNLRCSEEHIEEKELCSTLDEYFVDRCLINVEMTETEITISTWDYDGLGYRCWERYNH